MTHASLLAALEADDYEGAPGLVPSLPVPLRRPIPSVCRFYFQVHQVTRAYSVPRRLRTFSLAGAVTAERVVAPADFGSTADAGVELTAPRRSGTPDLWDARSAAYRAALVHLLPAFLSNALVAGEEAIEHLRLLHGVFALFAAPHAEFYRALAPEFAGWLAEVSS